MKDIFENTILCSSCSTQMQPLILKKNGFNLRAVKCGDCGETIAHPQDKHEYEEFMRLKKKDYEVKMRMVGNSYAVSIPREIVDFMHEQERMMSDMVRLSFQDANRLSLMFDTPEDQEQTQRNGRVVKAKEVRVTKNGKTQYHTKEFIDSAHPQRNKKVVYKSDKQKDE